MCLGGVEGGVNYEMLLEGVEVKKEVLCNVAGLEASVLRCLS